MSSDQCRTLCTRAPFGLLLLAVAAIGWSTQTATGVVFNDRNGNGRRDAGEEGLAGVRVSNSLDVVATDKSGTYKLPVTEDTVIFVVKPSGWAAPLDSHNVSRFYYIYSPEGSPKLRHAGVAPTGPLPKSIDFPLRKADEGRRFEALLFGDPQVGSLQTVDFFAHSMVDGLDASKYAFGVSLGDIVGDAPPMQEAIAQAHSAIGIPWWFVPGNHDRNYDAPDEEHTYENWKTHYGPSYYSFDYGKVHFIAMEDIMPTTRPHYAQGIGEKKLQWLRNDLKMTPKDRLVVFMAHIPLLEPVKERKEILEAMAPFKNTLSVAAHWHTQAVGFLGKKEGWPNEKPHLSVVAGAPCGGWYGGELDAVGLPMALNLDGTPPGYLVLSVDGTSYKMRYQAARRPADYQMNITIPDGLPSSETAGTEVVVNVFFGSEASKVEMQVDGKTWQPMTRSERPDPNIERIVKLQNEKKLPATGAPTYMDKTVPHIWVAKLPALAPGVHIVMVRHTDVFGQISQAKRVVRVD